MAFPILAIISGILIVANIIVWTDILVRDITYTLYQQKYGLDQNWEPLEEYKSNAGDPIFLGSPPT
jgi:hypothetical protein